MITLRWAQYPEADVASYRVYRSIIGFIAPIVPLASLAGKTMQLRMNGGALQTITFDSSTPVVDKINATLTGGRAYLSNIDSNQFLVRSDLRQAPGSVDIVGGTALAVLGVGIRTVTEQSEDSVVATVPAPGDPDEVVEYDDADGVLQDYYALTTTDSLGSESLKTAYKQPITSSGALCVLEGLVIDLQGVRVPDAEVKATLIKFPHSPTVASHITLEPVTTLSGSDGRFSLPLLQGALVQLEVPALGYSRNVTVPAKAFEFITDLEVDTDYQYPTNTTGV